MKMAIREILITVFLALLLFVAIRGVAHNFHVKGYSMEPNLYHGQFIIVSKVDYWFTAPQRGDIVVFNTDRLDHGIVHRIVGLPGEVIELRNGILYVNGEKWEEHYIRGYSLQGRSISVSPRKVPYGNFFIIGDNRSMTSWDIVPRREIIGRAWMIYWPISAWGRAPNHAWESGITGQGQPGQENPFRVDAGKIEQ